MDEKVQTTKKQRLILPFKVLVIFGLILISSLIPLSASANIIASQEIATSTKENCPSNQCYQNLGNNLTAGELTEIELLRQTIINSNAYSIQLFELANESLYPVSPFDGVATSTQCGLQSGELNNEGYAQTADNPTHGTWASTNSPSYGTTLATTTYTFSGVTIKPNCYYGFGWRNQLYGEYLYGASASAAYRTETQDNNINQSPRDLYFIVRGGDDSTQTRIIYFSPSQGETVASTSPVTFNLQAYVNSDDVGDIKGVRVTLHNIDQNDLLFGSFSSWSSNDIVLVDEELEAGNYSTTTSATLEAGNYRLKACLDRSLFGFTNFYLSLYTSVVDDSPDCLNHTFIVGESTFIGSLNQNTFNDLQDFTSGLTATSSEALARTCNPLSADFGIRECMLYLWVPDPEKLSVTFTAMKAGILTRVPWGYLTRFGVILSSTGTSSLPSFTTTVRIGESENTTLAFNPTDMLAGASALVDSIADPVYGKTMRDIFYPFVQVIVALAVLFQIVSDIMGSHEHVNSGKERE